MRPAKQLQLADRTETNSLDIYKRSYLGSIHKIWLRLSVGLLMNGEKHGWQKITKTCKGIPEGGQDVVLSGVLGTGVGTGQPQDMS